MVPEDFHFIIHFLQIIFKIILLLTHPEKVSKLLNTGLKIPKSLLDIDWCE